MLIFTKSNKKLKNVVDVTISNEKVLLDGASETDGLLGADERGQCANLPAAYAKSEACAYVKQQIGEENTKLRKNPIIFDGKVKEYASSFWKQSQVLAVRTFIQTIRNPMVTYAQLGQTLFISLLVGTIYWQIGNDQGSIQDRVGALFFMMTNQAFGMIASLNICKAFVSFIFIYCY